MNGDSCVKDVAVEMYQTGDIKDIEDDFKSVSQQCSHNASSSSMVLPKRKQNQFRPEISFTELYLISNRMFRYWRLWKMGWG